MAVCYKKLWKLLIDKNMNKTELRMASGITTTALAKLGIGRMGFDIVYVYVQFNGTTYPALLQKKS